MTDAVLGALAKALTTGDVSAVTPLLCLDAAIWHNYDGIDVPAGEALSLATALPALVDDLSFHIAHRVEVPGGIIAQFELAGTVKASNLPLRVRNCVFVWMGNDRIRRMEEYVDPTFAAQLGIGA